MGEKYPQKRVISLAILDLKIEFYIKIPHNTVSKSLKIGDNLHELVQSGPRKIIPGFRVEYSFCGPPVKFLAAGHPAIYICQGTFQGMHGIIG